MLKDLKTLLNDNDIEFVQLWRDRDPPAAGFKFCCAIGDANDDEDFVGHGPTVEKAFKNALNVVKGTDYA